ncbi:MAG: ATP-dependent DNA helicase RecG [Candidatus Kerfeldbacteria bacterium]|nr:ATP-dependent DNA helicase RecG [Candidatus Kerfeldbacteria bacterium]
MPSLLTPIKSLRGVRPEIAEKFTSLGLTTLQDALFHFPIRHQDFRQRVSIDRLTVGQEVTVVGQISSIKARPAWRRRMNVTEAVVTDRTGGRLAVVWFNQPYLATWFKIGQWLYLSGRVSRTKQGKLQLQNPFYERPTANPSHEKLVPVYPSTAGLSQWQIRRVMKQAVALISLVPETLPADIRQSLDLSERAEALRQIHFPTSPEAAAAAVRRLKFDELLAWQLRWQHAATLSQRHPAPTIPFRQADIRAFVRQLPFPLTHDQRLAAWQILQDLQRTEPMARLLQGDVGSGKTLVAAMAAFNAVLGGWQVAWLAPTVVLAEQHWQTLSTLLPAEHASVGFLSSSGLRLAGQRGPISRSDFTARLQSGTINLVVATHALLAETVGWHRLGLVIIDEQQRFGVQQRQQLLERQIAAGQPMPHFLSLTATPIPRTLALFLTGQLSISALRHKPVGRQPIPTTVIGPAGRAQVDRVTTETVGRGEQVFVITPLIVESDALGVRAATSEAERLTAAWPKLRIGLLHGSLPANERLQILQRFRQHQLDLLVSTTVIEVGIDVPNATLMIIEGAERFGLAQLHQLRGRVGRGSRPSRCFLVTDQTSEAMLDRLHRVAKIDDGYRLAELDLELRGGGDLYGLRQSGLPDWQLATLLDTALMEAARLAARDIIAHRSGLVPQLIPNSDHHGLAFHRE